WRRSVARSGSSAPPSRPPSIRRWTSWRATAWATRIRSAAVDEPEQLLAGLELRLVPGDEDLQVLPRCDDEHRDAVGAQAGVAIASAVRLRLLDDRNLVTGLDSGQQCLVGGGAVEQNRHPGEEVRRSVGADRELEHVLATEVLGEVRRDHRVQGLIV